jgi:ribosomal protein S18 acetylase RimI-like enzyme
MSTNLLVRRAQADDAAAYRELRLMALREHPEAFGGDPEEEAARPLEFWCERLDPERNRNSAQFVAERNGDLIGMMIVVQMAGAKVQQSAWIYSVYLQPAARGLGLADTLLQACVDWAGVHGVCQLKLSVVTTNLAAIRLYLRHGFHVYGVDPAVLAVGSNLYDELLMVRQLPIRDLGAQA